MEAQTVTDSGEERIRSWLMAAADWGNEGLTWDHITAGIADGAYHLLANDDAAILLEPYQQADGRLNVCVLLAGGKLEGVERLLAEAETIARDSGAFKLTVIGREGWRSLAKKIGYRTEAVHYSKDL